MENFNQASIVALFSACIALDVFTQPLSCSEELCVGLRTLWLQTSCLVWCLCFFLFKLLLTRAKRSALTYLQVLHIHCSSCVVSIQGLGVHFVVKVHILVCTTFTLFVDVCACVCDTVCFNFSGILKFSCADPLRQLGVSTCACMRL